MVKEENKKVGRPRLADTDLKKKSLIISGICLIVTIILVGVGLTVLNVIPFNKMKGEVVCSLSDIPENLRPGGDNEYGFDDAAFYSAVVSAIPNNTSCEVTPEQLATITYLDESREGITSANGIQYLTGLISLYLVNNQLTSIDLSHNTVLECLYLHNNQLTSIDLSHNTALNSLGLNHNNLVSIDLSHNTELYDLSLPGNNLNEINLSNNQYLEDIILNNNNLNNIKFNKQSNEIYRLFLNDNNLNDIDLSFLDNDGLLLTLQNNPMMSTKYILKGQMVKYNPIKFKKSFNLEMDVSNNIIGIAGDFIVGLIEGVTNIKYTSEYVVTFNPAWVYYESISSSSYDDEEIADIILDKYGITMDELYEEYDSGYNFNIFSQEIKVYDITSDKYSIDKDNKKISYSGNFDISNITLTLEGLEGKVEDNNYIIKDGDVLVDTYKLVKTSIEDTKSDNRVTTTTKKNSVATTKKSNKKKNNKVVTTTNKEVTTNEKQSKIINKLVSKTTTNEVKENAKDIKWYVVLPIALIGISLIGFITYNKRK